MVDFLKAKEHAVHLLQTRLSPDLHYHNLEHTLDVCATCERIAGDEGVQDTEELLLLKTAAMYHDTGFVNVYDHHEEEGCRLVAEILPNFGYSAAQIEEICGLIMKTKIPQTPETHLQRILCDADLDHLGRDDFWKIGVRLFNEWKAIGKVTTEQEWNEIQIQFLEGHTYWTSSSHKSRDEGKVKHLDALTRL